MTSTIHTPLANYSPSSLNASRIATSSFTSAATTATSSVPATAYSGRRVGSSSSHFHHSVDAEAISIDRPLEILDFRLQTLQHPLFRFFRRRHFPHFRFEQQRIHTVLPHLRLQRLQPFVDFRQARRSLSGDGLQSLDVVDDSFQPGCDAIDGGLILTRRLRLARR